MEELSQTNPQYPSSHLQSRNQTFPRLSQSVVNAKSTYYLLKIWVYQIRLNSKYCLVNPETIIYSYIEWLKIRVL